MIKLTKLSFRCSTCTKWYTAAGVLSTHGKNCNKRQEAYHTIKKYRSLYDGVKKYTCPYDLCAYVTSRQQVMTDHINSHDGVKPHTCPHELCAFATTYKSSYKSHMQSFHTRPGIVKKSKKCLVSYEKYNHRGYLWIRM